MDAGTLPSDLCGGAFGPSAFQQGIPWAGSGPTETAPPDPRPIEIVKQKKPPANFTLSRQQAVTNDRISRALFARATATLERVNGLTGA